MDTPFKSSFSALQVTKKKTPKKYHEDRKYYIPTTQNYHALREEWLKSKKLFIDSDFPATDASVFHKKGNSNIVWKRPQELTSFPRFFIDGASRFDVKQGEIGNCWMLAAVSNLTLHDELFKHVVPDDQDFDHNYAGIFHFWFWQFGEWVEVIIDDRLPTCDNKLIYLHAEDTNEFWSSLLEKAYAKLHGSYSALNSGVTSDAMLDFTGGLTEIFTIEPSRADLFPKMLQGFERGSLLACSIRENPDSHEECQENGLVRGHAYSVTAVKDCQFAGSSQHHVQLIRMRNPWGNGTEWTGSWSDGSPEWLKVSSTEKDSLGLTFQRDGEFWICYEDFSQNFSILEMTNVNLHSMTDSKTNGKAKQFWEVQRLEGAWIKGVSAGGCTNYPKTFPQNPKFVISMDQMDDGLDGNCTLIVSLIQRSTRKKKQKTNLPHAIGFSLFALPPHTSETNVDKKFFKNSREVPGLTVCSIAKQVSHRFEIPMGKYCLVPCTMAPNEEGEFILRLFTEKNNPVINRSDSIGFQAPAHLGKDQHETENAHPHWTSPWVGPEHITPWDLSAPAGTAANEFMSWRELQVALNSRFKTDVAFEGFSKNTCRYLVSMMYDNQQTTQQYDSLAHLCAVIASWKDSFQRHDVDWSGFLDGYEFREALSNAGFVLSDVLMKTIIQRYGNDDKIDFDDFVVCLIKLSKLFGYFQEKDTERFGLASFTLQEFIENSI